MKSNIGSKERGYEPIQNGIKGEEYALKRKIPETRTRREEETRFGCGFQRKKTTS